MEKNKEIINKAIRYAKQFEGMNYKCSPSKPSKRDGSPFWINDIRPPDVKYIYKKGSCCTGLTNLVRRYLNLHVPYDICTPWKGSTCAWFNYLKKNKRLEKINFNKVYPKGTLLLQDYNVKDQGHVAFTINSSKKGLLYSKIIHNVKGKFELKKYSSVTIEKVIDYPYYERHTHVCLPENWLLKE